MDNKTKKEYKPSFFRKIKKIVRKAIRRTKKAVYNFFDTANNTLVETLYPESIKNKALKKEYLKLLSLRIDKNQTNLDTLTANMSNSTINSISVSPLEAEIIKRIELINSKEKAKALHKAYRKRIVSEKFKKSTTINPDTKANGPLICAIKSNPLPEASYIEVINNGEKPIFIVQQNNKKNLTLHNYHQNTKE